MQLLLDTHAFIWWVLGDASLSAVAKAQIGNSANQVFVSAASAWEITTKYRLGRLPQAAPLAADFPRIVVAQGFIPLAITMRHGARAGSFSVAHRDPFDRMLAAQAVIEHMPIISSDAALDLFGCNPHPRLIERMEAEGVSARPTMSASAKSSPHQ